MRNGKYVLVLAPPDYPGKRYRGRYCYEHRLNWWKTHRVLPPDGQVVHHKDTDPGNNGIGNLQQLTTPSHSSLHARPQTMVELKCLGCGIRFSRPKRRVHNGKGVCSKACRGRACGRSRPMPAATEEPREYRLHADGTIEDPPYAPRIVRDSRPYRPKRTAAMAPCTRCGVIKSAALQFCSLKCASAVRARILLTAEELAVLVAKSNKNAVARSLGVSEAAVRKKLRHAGLYEPATNKRRYNGRRAAVENGCESQGSTVETRTASP